MALPTLETDRFILRPMERSDIDLMVEMDTDPEITKYIGGPISEDQVRNKFDYYLHRDDEKAHGHWCILDKSSAQTFGCVLVKPMPIEDPNGRLFSDVPADGVEIGYRLRKSAWGQGIATEAASAFLPLQFDEIGLNRLRACILEGNEASQKVLKKLGMRYIGMTMAYGESSPTYELSAAEWRAARNS